MIENHMVQGNANHDAELPQEWHDKALDEVIDTVLATGQWPDRTTGAQASHRRVEFDLIEWLYEEYDGSDIARVFLTLLTDFSNDADLLRLNESAKLERKLREYFADSEIVAELGARMMDEADHGD